MLFSAAFSQAKMVSFSPLFPVVRITVERQKATAFSQHNDTRHNGTVHNNTQLCNKNATLSVNDIQHNSIECHYGVSL
jgi:hypothetical protein